MKGGTMLHVVQVSGEEVAALSQEDMDALAQASGSLGLTGKAVKHHLSTLLGYSRFRQRLLSEGSEICDPDVIEGPMTLQLVILQLCSDTEHNDRLWWAMYRSRASELEESLQVPVDPDDMTGARQFRDQLFPGDTALCIAAFFGHVHCVDLLLQAKADTKHAGHLG